MSFQSFENDVKMYGTQTSYSFGKYLSAFENDVKMYGTQTVDISSAVKASLRMM